ncbi:hypothetical protein RUM43_001608 [Polyplax serrata]|uniref:Uncharacterized protein n=1 Tax=Polyplax serrata TaxID=468196 RepID=A0AAN8SEK7_POLSC
MINNIRSDAVIDTNTKLEFPETRDVGLDAILFHRNSLCTENACIKRDKNQVTQKRIMRNKLTKGRRCEKKVLVTLGLRVELVSSLSTCAWCLVPGVSSS